ncbi:hypothetical protein OEZ86_003150 [Tetradesmus obliquus]|nr:hypothetical protein OEZ86_003150 [Tetradesmus obliquus]
MVRGNAKIEAQKKAAKKQEQMKSAGSQLDARKAALKFTCPICRPLARHGYKAACRHIKPISSARIGSACRAQNNGGGLLEQSPAAVAAAAVEYTVGQCRFAISSRPSGTGSLLLRLSEQSDEFEYVAVVPAAVAGILLDVLHKAVACLQAGSWRPLELHHHLLLGSRTFTCSMAYDTPAAEQQQQQQQQQQAGSASSSTDAAAFAAERLVRITVQEKGRSSVHLLMPRYAAAAQRQQLGLSIDVDEDEEEGQAVADASLLDGPLLPDVQIELQQ